LDELSFSIAFDNEQRGWVQVVTSLGPADPVGLLNQPSEFLMTDFHDRSSLSTLTGGLNLVKT